jgi:hypothetical protein
MDDTEYDFVIADAVSKNLYVDRKDALLSDGTKLGTIVTYSDGYRSPYAHLRSSMLGYACINLFSMINIFPDFAVRVAVDSFYIDVKHSDAVAEFTNPDEIWGSWRIKKKCCAVILNPQTMKLATITYAVIIYQNVLMHHRVLIQFADTKQFI